MARSAVPKLFWVRPKTEFGEHFVTQASNNVRKNNCCMDDTWKQAAKFLFNFRNLLASAYAADRQWQTVVTLKINNPDFITSARPIFRRFATVVWLSTHTLGTTGLINFSAKPWWQLIVASFSQKHNHFPTLRRLWTEWVKHLQICLRGRVELSPIYTIVLIIFVNYIVNSKNENVNT